MRKIREVIRLRHGLKASAREIAPSVGIARSTVAEYLYRSEAAGLSWPLPEDLSDEELERLLFPPVPSEGEPSRPMPDWSYVQKELSRKGVTLLLLWREYKDLHPNGYGYSRYASLYHEWLDKTDLRMLQHHKAGERLFVDFAGLTMLVPDNLKSGVTSADRFEPVVNQAFAEFARHYDLAVLPARPKRPRDKAKVENAVLQVERWILAPLRDRTFFSLDELNSEIAVKVAELDVRVMKGPNASRRELFDEIDRPAMRALCMPRYQFANWKRAKVAPDYHVEFQGHRYSVPYSLVGKHVDLRVSLDTLEIFQDGRRVCGHARSLARRGFTTSASHMPVAHREYAEWTPERLENWAAQTGPSTKEFVARMMATKLHPQQAFRSCMGVISLSKNYSAERLEAACARALRYGAQSYRNVKTILEKGLDKEEVQASPSLTETGVHANVRGAEYYAEGATCAN